MDRLLKWAGVVGMLLGGGALFVNMAAKAEDGPQKERLVRLETQQDSTKEQFKEIKQQLVRIEEKLDRLRSK